MSKPSAPRKRDKYLDVLPFRRSRSKSPAQSVPAFSTTSQSRQATAPRTILQEDVLIRLDPEHQRVICDYCTDSLDIGAAIQRAIETAEEKKRICIEKQWSVTTGGKKIVLRDKVNTVVDLISKFKDIGSIAVGADPVHAGLPWAGICLLLQVVVADKEQMDALINGILVALSSQQTADLYLGCYNDQPTGPHADNLRENLITLYAAILAFLAEALRLLGASGRTRFCNALLGDDDLRKFPSNCRERLEDVGSAVRLCDRQLDKRTAELVADTKQHVEDVADQLEDLLAEAIRTRTKIDLAKLPIAAGAQYDAYDPDLSTCFKGTRIDLLEEVSQWANDPKGECFYWLQGKAGEGKSTIAKTLAETLQKQGLLGASFFFKHGHTDRGSARLFFSTIAARLVQKIDGLGSAVAKVLDAETSMYDKSVQVQFEDLIAAPLRKSGQSLPSASGRLIIVVDALDECYDRDIKQVIDLLAQAETFSIRTFIASRPDAPVVAALAGLKHAQCRTVILETQTQATIDHDISLFLTQRLSNIRSDNPDFAIGWPGRDRTEELTRRSVPLFIFAATVCRFLLTPGSTPEELLHTVLEEPSRLPLTMTYRPILERWLAVRAPVQSREAAIAEFRNIVGPILLSAEPLPISLAAMLSHLEIDKLEARLSLLRSVLQTGRHDGDEDYTIKAFHLSFQDFIVKSEESLDFKIDEQQTHKAMAAACLSLMMQPGRLRQDICAVSKPGTRRRDVDLRLINDHIKPDLAYACRYWLHHQVRSREVLDDSHQVYEFLTSRFVYWFEAMAWLGRSDEALRVLTDLKGLTNMRLAEPMIATTTHGLQLTNSDKLLKLSDDAHCFIRVNRYIADQAPLQIYASALVFAPECSPVKSLFKICMPRWLAIPPKGARVWDDDTLVLEGHTDGVIAMAFSTGDEYFVTSSRQDIRVWEPATGLCILKLPRPEGSHPVGGVCFSHDSRYFATAYKAYCDNQFESGTWISVYGTKTGAAIKCFRAGIPYWSAIRLAFTPDAHDILLVAFRYKGTLEMWRVNIKSGVTEQSWIMQAQTKRDRDFAFSANTSLISSLSPDSKSVFSWDIQTGVHVSTQNLDGHSSCFARFIECGGMDLVYATTGDELDRTDDGEYARTPGLYKLDTQTGRVDPFARMDPRWSPEAISLQTGRIAMTKDDTGVVNISLKSNDFARQTPYLSDVTITKDGKMLLLRYQDHLKLQDMAGHVVFQSSKIAFGPDPLASQSVSDHGSVITARLDHETRVWFVKSGRELQLPETGQWLCSPVVSSDHRLIAFCLNGASDPSRKHVMWAVDDTGEHTHIVFVRTHFLLWDLESNQELLKTEATERSFIPKSGSHWLRFSDDHKTLHTYLGDLNIEKGEWATDDSCENRFQRSVADDENFWVQLGEEDVMWLPESYRPRRGRCASRCKNTVAYVCRANSLVAMTFTDPCDTTKY